MKQPSKDETSLEKGSTISKETINRNEVLTWLKEDIEWLRKKARNKCPPKNSIRVHLMRASIYGCSVLMSGLKDIELEQLNERLKVLEEKAAKGVFVS